MGGSGPFTVYQGASPPSAPPTFKFPRYRSLRRKSVSSSNPDKLANNYSVTPDYEDNKENLFNGTNTKYRQRSKSVASSATTSSVLGTSFPMPPLPPVPSVPQPLKESLGRSKHRPSKSLLGGLVNGGCRVAGGLLRRQKTIEHIHGRLNTDANNSSPALPNTAAITSHVVEFSSTSQLASSSTPNVLAGGVGLWQQEQQYDEYPETEVGIARTITSADDGAEEAGTSSHYASSPAHTLAGGASEVTLTTTSPGATVSNNDGSQQQAEGQGQRHGQGQDASYNAAPGETNIPGTPIAAKADSIAAVTTNSVTATGAEPNTTDQAAADNATDQDKACRETAVQQTPVKSTSATLATVQDTPNPATAAGTIEASGTPTDKDGDGAVAKAAAEVARLEAETDRILAEQKRKDLARLQAQLGAADSTPQKSRSPIFEKFSALISRRKTGSLTPPPSSTTTSVDFTSSFNGCTSSAATSVDARMGIEPYGTKVAAPLSPETPTSAVNANGNTRSMHDANEKARQHVVVRCKQSSLDLPVEWETTTLDMIYTASDCLNRLKQDINPAASLLVETFPSLGLERRLRRYELIRDVLNSWDKDSQNSLLVVPQDSADSDQDLEEETVPRTTNAPNGFSLYLHHSSKPGKWAKRYITLLESGQMYASKKPDFKTGDKDCVAICHLSDFDIYTPTEHQMRRHLKAPRQYCYAVKSQQKSTLFVSLDRYVHYFSTDDAAVAQRFHALVHAWRSWYLINRRVELAIRKKTAAPKITPVKHAPKKSISVVNVDGRRLRVSIDESPYAVGTFEPLIDLKRFNKPLDEFGKDFLPDSANPPRTQQQQQQQQQQRRASLAGNSLSSPLPELTSPITSPPHTLIHAAGGGANNTAANATTVGFQPQGLLGEAYDARKQLPMHLRAAAVANKAVEQTPNSPPSADKDAAAFTDGDTLLNQAIAAATASERTVVRINPQPDQQSPRVQDGTETSETTNSEPQSWFPSAQEHSAKTKAQQEAAQRALEARNAASLPATRPNIAAAAAGPLAYSHYHQSSHHQQQHHHNHPQLQSNNPYYHLQSAQSASQAGTAVPRRFVSNAIPPIPPAPPGFVLGPANPSTYNHGQGHSHRRSHSGNIMLRPSQSTRRAPVRPLIDLGTRHNHLYPGHQGGQLGPTQSPGLDIGGTGYSNANNYSTLMSPSSNSTYSKALSPLSPQLGGGENGPESPLIDLAGSYSPAQLQQMQLRRESSIRHQNGGNSHYPPHHMSQHQHQRFDIGGGNPGVRQRSRTLGASNAGGSSSSARAGTMGRRPSGLKEAGRRPSTREGTGIVTQGGALMRGRSGTLRY